MAEPITQNGVTFTPTKVVNLDEMFAKDKETTEQVKTEEVKEEPVNTEEVKTDPVKTDKVKTDPIKEEPKVDNEPKDIPLDEVFLEVGEERLNANEFLDRYESVSQELNEIKNDEFLSKLIAFRKSGGDPAEFLKKATVKWDQASEISLLRSRFDEENKDLTGEVKEILFERKLREQYGVNPDGTFDDEDSRDAKVGRELMKRDADKYRATKIEEQKNFLITKEEPQKQVKQPDTEAVRKSLLEDKELQNFISSKAVPVSADLSYEVEDPNKVIGMMANVGEFFKIFAKPDGTYDKQALAKVFAFALNPKKYDDSILKLGEDRGEAKYLKEQKNTSGKTQTVISTATDKDQIVVRGGKIISNGDREDFLKQAASQRKR